MFSFITNDLVEEKKMNTLQENKGEESRPGTAGTSLHQMLVAPASFSPLLKAEKLDLRKPSSETAHG